jgi:hypothetical protein
MLRKLCRVPFFPGAPLNAIRFIAVRWRLTAKNVDAVAEIFLCGLEAAGDHPGRTGARPAASGIFYERLMTRVAPVAN